MIKPSVIVNLLFAVCLIGCGGSSSTEPVDYSGTWDLVYNYTVNTCVEGDVGFLDVHTITDTRNEITFVSESSIIEPSTIEIRDDNSLYLKQFLKGDLFGDGSYCEYTRELTYDVPENNSAESMFAVDFWCDDGWSCETRSIGLAEKQTAAPAEGS